MFRIDRIAQGDRLEADTALTLTDFAAIAAALGRDPIRARKVGFVAARHATAPENIETRWNGRETINVAQPGDFVVTNLTPLRQPLRDDEGHLNVYVITAGRFTSLYEPTGESMSHGGIYRAKGFVFALPLPGGFDIMAPWGERQTATAGYLLLNGDQVSGSSWDAFVKTYESSSA